VTKPRDHSGRHKAMFQLNSQIPLVSNSSTLSHSRTRGVGSRGCARGVRPLTSL